MGFSYDISIWVMYSVYKAIEKVDLAIVVLPKVANCLERLIGEVDSMLHKLPIRDRNMFIFVGFYTYHHFGNL